MKQLPNNKLIFSNSYLLKLILPLFGEQFFSILVGIIDSIMVASCGESAISGVSLIDTIYALFFFLATAFATGGAVVTSQYLGRKEYNNAKGAAKQLIYISVIFGILTALFFIPIKKQLISLIFGNLEKSVFDASITYFDYIFLSIPFLCLFSSASALFRSAGNSKISLQVSIIMNILNVVFNAILIYGLNMGVKGAGIATLISRAVAGVLMIFFITKLNTQIRIKQLFKVRFNWYFLKKIFAISIPNAIENSVFQFGKIAVQSLVASLGVASIAANVVVGNLCTFANLPGVAISLASTTIIGQCLGAGEKKQARHYSKILISISVLAISIFAFVLILFRNPIIALYNLTPTSASLASSVSFIVLIMTSLLWTFAFSTPNLLRAAGDVKFTLVCSIISLFLFRITGAYVFTKIFEFGLMGIWLAMIVDWICRSSCYLLRIKGNVWLEKKVI
ncbi:MAG: MATE family efflux transporter [Spirochaetia bacterium]|nr:MATE family efflux transporter [Spirochaetia bacterium]